MSTTTDITTAIARCDEHDLIVVMRTISERLTALGHESIADYLGDAVTDLRYLVDRQTELDRESEAFSREWSTVTATRKCGMDWALIATGEAL